MGQRASVLRSQLGPTSHKKKKNKKKNMYCCFKEELLVKFWENHIFEYLSPMHNLLLHFWIATLSLFFVTPVMSFKVFSKYFILTSLKVTFVGGMSLQHPFFFIDTDTLKKKKREALTLDNA